MFTLLGFPGFHMGQIPFVLFSRSKPKCLERRAQSFPIEKVFAVFIFYRNRKIYHISPFEQWGYTSVCMRASVCVWNVTHSKHTTQGFIVCIQIKIWKPAWNPNISHVKCRNCNQNMKELLQLSERDKTKSSLADVQLGGIISKKVVKIIITFQFKNFYSK